MVFSASSFHWASEGDPYVFLRKHLLWLPLAFIGWILASRIDPSLLRRYYWQPLVVAGILLAVVLIPHVGRDVNASRRWLPLGGGLQIQPSELAKLAVVLFVAGFMVADPRRARSFLGGFAVVCAAVFPVFLLVLAEPDFGTSVFILGLAFFVLYFSGARIWYFLGSGLLFLPVIAGFVYYRWEQVRVRLLGFLEPETIYQVKHSLTALGSGGIWGLGLGGSTQKLRFLPEPHTDFILAIAGEELGFVGTVGIVLVFVALLWSGVALVQQFRDLFSFLVGSGIVMAIAFQAALNIAVVTASAPTKGIALPFVTFGGSGLCVALVQVGILCALDRHNRLRIARTESS
jgi:cell division protein FtsW